jgi:hypothetical protein
MHRYIVMREFRARELNGPFARTIGVGEELMLMRWAGEEHDDSAIFAVLIEGEEGGVTPGPEYEVPRPIFEDSTQPA